MRYSFYSLLALAASATASISNGAGPAAGTKIPNNYMVVFKPTTPMGVVNAHKNEVNAYQQNSAIMRRGIKKHFRGVKDSFQIGRFKGYSGEFDADTLKKIQADPDVAYIEQEQVYRIMTAPNDPHAQTVEGGAPWGLNRISHLRAPGSDATGEYDYDEKTAGEGVDVYVIDTGVYAQHPEFEGRATFAIDFSGTNATTDDNGHGTHCSGTIAGKTYGVAKKAHIYGVKVLSGEGSGTTSGVTQGINWAAKAAKKSGRPSVASMSLGGPDGTDRDSKALKDAVTAAVEQGMVFAVAAGNDGSDARDTSPANVPKAITVGAIDSKDAIASWSNYGKVLDIFAPGVNILSAWNDGKTNTISGTSMATPHVAGLAAYFLSADKSLAGDAMVGKMTGGAVSCSVTGNIHDSPNKIAYNGQNGTPDHGSCGGGADPDPGHGGEDPDPSEPQNCDDCDKLTDWNAWLDCYFKFCTNNRK